MIVISEDRQESGRERRGETCSKGCGERDSNTQLAVRPALKTWSLYVHTLGLLGHRGAPSFNVFEIEAKQYIKTIYYSKYKKAVKTIALCSVFDIFC